MEMQMEINDLGLSPSFSCYFSDSLTTTTAMAAAKVSREFIHEQQSAAKFHEFSDVDDEEDDFEFSQVFDNDNEKQVFSGKQISVNRLPPAAASVDFPVGELDIQIRKLYVNGGETSSFFNSSSSSSTESEIESNGPSGSFCMWRPKSDVVSPILTKCKKSSSSAAGSGSRRRWRRILDLLRRSNGGSIFFLRSNKKIKASKQNRKVTPVEVAGKLKSVAGGSSPPSFHELFYARKRAEKEGDKMKSFLPYRQDLLGFFVNINRIGSKKSTTF